MGNRLVEFLNKHHIQRLISEPYHPEHNSRAERANQTIVESMRATFRSSGISKTFWHEVVKSCCLMLNQVPQKGESRSPWETFHGKKFPSNLLKPLGTTAVVLKMNRVKGRKFEEKGQEGFLVGFNVLLHSYRIITQSGAIIESKHVRFLKLSNPDFKLSDDGDFFPEKRVEERE